MLPIITHVAIITKDGIVHSLPKPNRHHNILNLLNDIGYSWPITGEQGFLTDTGIYLNRLDGAALALKNGQVKKLNSPPKLFSEDLW